jgi:hypothetical protein
VDQGSIRGRIRMPPNSRTIAAMFFLNKPSADQVPRGITRLGRIIVLAAMTLSCLHGATAAKDHSGGKTPVKKTTNSVKQTNPAATVIAQPTTSCAPIDAWLISTRHLGCTQGAFPATGPALRYWQRVNNQGPWQARTFEDFLAASQEICTTWIMIHGNRMSSHDAVNYGSQVTRSLLPGHRADLPLRTITWSWPSDRVHGLIEDVRSKAARTPSESFYLGWLVNQMPASTPICYIGHSFGARIGTGTMHLLAGGALHGYGLAGIDPARQLSRGIFTAAAIHNNWLLPGAPHGRALDQAESILFVNNSCDPALKRYRFIDRSRPEAIGYCGAMIDAGRRHNARCEYFHAGQFVAREHADVLADQLGAATADSAGLRIPEFAAPASRSSGHCRSQGGRIAAFSCRRDSKLVGG